MTDEQTYDLARDTFNAAMQSTPFVHVAATAARAALVRAGRDEAVRALRTEWAEAAAWLERMPRT